MLSNLSIMDQKDGFLCDLRKLWPSERSLNDYNVLTKQRPKRTSTMKCVKIHVEYHWISFNPEGRY